MGNRNKLTNKELLEKAKTLNNGQIFLMENGSFKRICPICEKSFVLTRQQLIANLKSDKIGCCSRSCAAKNRPSARINSVAFFEKGKEIDSTLERDGNGFSKKCPICGKRFPLTQTTLRTRLKKNIWSLGFCSKSCAAKFHRNTEEEKELRQKKAIERYGSIEARNHAVYLKQKEGIEKKYGSYSAFMKAVSKKGRETYFKKTGYSHNMRNPECMKINQEHRLATIRNFSKEQKERWYKARLETQKRNGTLLFGGKKPKSTAHSRKADSFFKELATQPFFVDKKCYFGVDEIALKSPKEQRWVFPDFFDEDDSIIVEFYGNFWHANPDYYKPQDIIKLPKLGEMTAEEIWKKDSERIDFIKNLGYDKIIIVWEKDYDEGKVTAQTIMEEINGL